MSEKIIPLSVFQEHFDRRRRVLEVSELEERQSTYLEEKILELEAFNESPIIDLLLWHARAISSRSIVTVFDVEAVQQAEDFLLSEPHALLIWDIRDEIKRYPEGPREKRRTAAYIDAKPQFTFSGKIETVSIYDTGFELDDLEAIKLALVMAVEQPRRIVVPMDDPGYAKGRVVLHNS